MPALILELIAFSTSGAPPITLNSSTNVKARVLDGTTWSALNEAYFNVHAAASAANLKITEVNYNPAPSTAGEPNIDNDEFEWIELANTSAGTIDLRSVRFTGGITFDFTNSSAATLAAGQRVLLVKNPTAFAARYPGDHNIAGTFTGQLDNSGENLTLTVAQWFVHRQLQLRRCRRLAGTRRRRRRDVDAHQRNRRSR